MYLTLDGKTLGIRILVNHAPKPTEKAPTVSVPSVKRRSQEFRE
jgi:hypothetical protein